LYFSDNTLTSCIVLAERWIFRQTQSWPNRFKASPATRSEGNPHDVEKAAQKRKTRQRRVSGAVILDRFAPPILQESLTDARAFLQRWCIARICRLSFTSTSENTYLSTFLTMKSNRAPAPMLTPDSQASRRLECAEGLLVHLLPADSSDTIFPWPIRFRVLPASGRALRQQLLEGTSMT
jgi:hypothetical protein